MPNVYLDYNATTPVEPAVMEAMLPWFTDQFWNAASAHGAGVTARGAIETARSQVAELINAGPRELVLTSGSTEANNLAIKGVAGRARGQRDTVLVAATEHKAVLDSADWLAVQGIRVEKIPVGCDGALDVAHLTSLLSDRVLLVSIMLANNETGIIQPLKLVSELAHRFGALVHTDATQAVGKINVDVQDLNVDMLSLSAHKFYGPKGVGALFVRRGIDLEAQLHGGGHESGHRSGTLNVPGVVGMGAAAQLAGESIDRDAASAHALTTKLIEGLRGRLDRVEWIGQGPACLPNTVSLRFVGADAEAVMANAPSVFVSSGSACSSRIPEPSYVLIAMGLSQDEAYECLRFSVGRHTTGDEIAAAVVSIAEAVDRVRGLASTEHYADQTEGAIR
ncbi:MAG: cysteine desulfurase [Phycicoccus sp.]|nr:cysteine desulfurase [Phycicoccus sp.]